MAVQKHGPGKNLPLSQATRRFKGKLIIYTKDGQQIAQSWNRGHKRPPTPAELEQRAEFASLVKLTKLVPADQQVAARDIAENSKYTWRDILSKFMTGTMVELGNYGEIVAQYNLDILGDQPGMIVIRTPAAWIALAIGDEGAQLSVIDGLPAWGPPATIELTGDVTGISIDGVIDTEIAPSGVTPGSYDFASLTVDDGGRITAASTGSAAPAGSLPHPGFVPGRYYTTNTDGPLSSTSATANRILLIPFYVPFQTTFTKLACFLAIGSTSNCKLGVYANAAGVPGALLGQSAALAFIGVAGKFETTGLSIPLAPGWYWLAAGFSGTPVMRSTPGSQGCNLNITGTDSALLSTVSMNGYSAVWTYSGTTLPDPCPAVTAVTGAIPVTWVGL
jgi:hypothetical protein